MKTNKWLGRVLVAVMTASLAACGGSAGQGQGPDTGPPPAATAPTLLPEEVRALMEHALRAVDRDMVVAVSDRPGDILGVAANFSIAGAACKTPNATPGSDCANASFAVQLARTAAFFSADQTPLTSRSIRFISDIHFPPRVDNTGAAALFGIENTNRGCSFDAGQGDALFQPGMLVPRALSLAAALTTQAGGPALTCASNGSRDGCTTGIATLPGGVPIFKNGRMAGGIGVVIRGSNPGPDFQAAKEGNVVLRRQDGDPDFDVAEFAARAFAGDPKVLVPTIVDKGLVNICANTQITPPSCCNDSPACTFSILPGLVPGVPLEDTLIAKIDPVIFIDGIEVPEVADNPPVPANVAPVDRPTFNVIDPATAPAARIVPGGWLVGPFDSSPGAQPISAAEVNAIIDAGVVQARKTRAAIRLPLEERTAMMLAVSDTNDTLIGLYRMDDATVFSIDVAVAKSRNVIWFSSPTINPADRLDSPAIGVSLGTAYDAGTAITNRTLSFGAQPLFPSGIDGSQPGPFRTVFLNDSATACTNGREPENGRQNGIVFFPGSVPLYRDGVLIGGFGVSGDGVEQDDIVTNGGSLAPPGFLPPDGIRADNVKVRGVRLPYLKFNRQPNE